MSNEYDESGDLDSVNRRKILQTLGVGGIASVGCIGLVSASNTGKELVDLEEVVEKYETKRDIRTAVETTVVEFIEALSDSKHIGRKTITKKNGSQLSLGKKVSGAEFDLESECVRVSGTFLEGKATAGILINHPVEDKVLQITVFPEINRTQAILRPIDEDSEDAWIRLKYTENGLRTDEFDPDASSDDNMSIMVEIYSDCLLSYEEGRGGGRYYCNEVTVQCWGSTTPEGCEIMYLSGECDGLDCSADHEDLCMEYCGYT